MEEKQLMSLVGALSATDKLLILQYLVDELVKQSGLNPLRDRDIPMSYGLHDSFEAAAILAKALE